MAIQSFFIPRNLSDRQFVDLPISGDLSGVLKRLGIRTLGDLNGISQKDFQTVSNHSSTLVIEIIELIHKLRAGQSSSNRLMKAAKQRVTTSKPLQRRACPVRSVSLAQSDLGARAFEEERSTAFQANSSGVALISCFRHDEQGF